MVGLAGSNFLMAQTFTVTTTNHGTLWTDAVCSGTPQATETLQPGSLAEALYQANRGLVNRIEFNLPANSTITMHTLYNKLCANNVVIDGTGAPNLTIAAPNTWSPGFIVTGTGNTIENINWTTNATQSSSLSIEGDNNIVKNCGFLNGNIWLGTVNPAKAVNGTTFDNCSINNGNLEVVGDNNTISGCTVSGNLVFGNVYLWKTLNNPIGKADFNVVENTTVGSPTATSRLIYFGEDNSADNVDLQGRGVLIQGSRNTIKNSDIVVVSNPQDDANQNLNGVLSRAAIEVTTNSSENVIESNTISATFSPINQTNNISGINVLANSITNQINDNTVTGFFNGIEIRQSTTNQITGNTVSQTVNHGILAWDSSNNNTITGNKTFENGFSGIDINGSTGNTISGNMSWDNTYNGIALEQGAQQNSISGNYVYSNATGIITYIASNNFIDGNFIGQDENGVLNGNSDWGIAIDQGSSNQVGTTSGNLIIGNGNGIQINASNSNIVVNNQIGNGNTTETGLENNGPGIHLIGGSIGNYIGRPGQANLIINSKSAAIVVDGTSTNNNNIRGNVTYGNTGKGIDHENNGNKDYGMGILTVNSAEPDANKISGKAVTAGDTVDIYLVDEPAHLACSATDASVTASPEAQGAQWIDFVLATTNSDGEVVWEYDLTDADAVAAGLTKDNAIVTATNPSSGRTSEFSTCEFDPPCTTPTSVNITVQGNDNSLCPDETRTLTANYSPAGGSFAFEWYKDGAIIAGETNNTLTVTDAGAGDYTVLVYDPIGKDICQTSSAAVTITVDNKPNTPLFADAGDICEGNDNVTLAVSNPSVDATYDWTGPTGTIKSGNSTSTITVDLSNETGSATYTVVATDENTTCSSEEATLTVDINELPEPNIDGDNSPLCSASGVVYTVTNANPNSTFKWFVPNGANIVGNATGSSITVDFGDQNGDITVIETTEKGCENATPASYSISLKSCGLKASFTSASDVCKGSGISFVNNSTGDNIVSYVWDFGTDATPATVTGIGPHEVSYSSTGTKTISLTITDDLGTTDTFTADIVVNELPDVSAISIDGNGGCEGTSGQFSVTPADPTNFDYSWTESTGGITSATNLPTIDVNFSIDGTTSVTITNKTTQCDASISKAYQVTKKVQLPELTTPSILCDNDYEVKKNNPYNFNLTSWNHKSTSVADWKIIDMNATPYDTLMVDTANGETSLEYGVEGIFIDNGFTGAQLITGENAEQIYQILVAVGDTSSCPTEIDTLKTTFVINRSHKYSFEIIKDTVCVGDDLLYGNEVYVDGKLTKHLDIPVAYIVGSPTTPKITDTENIFSWAHIQDTNRFAMYIDTIYRVDDGIDTFYVQEVQAGQVVLDTSHNYTYKQAWAFNHMLGDSIIMNARSQYFCYTDSSRFVDTLTNNIAKRPTGLASIVLDGQDPQIIRAELLDVDGNITLFDLHSDTLAMNLGLEIERQWYWKDAELDSFRVDGIVGSKTEKAEHKPLAIELTDYMLVNNNGYCVDTSKVQLFNYLAPWVPNVIAPGSGQYETLVIKNIENYPDAQIEIYNRWGNLVYEKTGYDNADGWDGTYNGKPLPVGTYFYIINFNKHDDVTEVQQQSGMKPITILR